MKKNKVTVQIPFSMLRHSKSYMASCCDVLCINMYVCTCICMYVHVFMYVCMYVCVDGCVFVTEM